MKAIAPLLAMLQLLLAGCFVSSHDPTPIATAQAKALLTREEFKAKVMGKTESEILDLIGKPSYTSGNAWTYHQQTYDKITGKEDHQSVLVFDNGKVEHVIY